MDVQTVVANVLTFNTNTFVRPALQGFSDADLLKRPSEACNPIGWLFWHQPRVEDLILSHISGRPQTWVAYTWHAQFGRLADPRDSGFGHSLEQVMALQPALAALQGYAARLSRSTQQRYEVDCLFSDNVSRSARVCSPHPIPHRQRN
jgi:hypothetical protein